MQVPAYNLPQEQLAPLPGARQESIASPSMLDAGAEQTEKLGKSITDAGSGLSAIAYHMDQRNIADSLFKTLSADKEAYIQYDAATRKGRQGDGAKGVASDTAAWWKDRISKNLDAMGTDRLKQLYSQNISEVQLQSLHSMSQFEAQQSDIGQEQNWKANKATTINLAAANPNGALVASSVADLKKNNAYRAAVKGWSPEVLDAQNLADTTELHKQVIQTLAAGDQKGAAAAYFTAHKDEIAGAAQAELGKFAEQATAADMGMNAAQAVVATDGPKNDTDPFNIDTMAAKIRTQFKDNSYARDAALQQLKEMKSEHDAGVHSRESSTEAQVNSLLLGGKSLASVMQTPAWAALNPSRQAVIKEHDESLQATRESRAASRESRAYTAEARQEMKLNRDGLDQMIVLSDPDKLIAMSRDDVVNLRTKIGAQNTISLLNKWDTFTKNGTALSEGKIDDQQFKSFAMRAGLDVTPTKNDDAGKEKLIELRDRVERIIGTEQQTRKRPLTRDEKDGILQKQIDNTVMQDNGLFSSNTKVPAITLPADKQADAYVTVNGEDIKLANIPAGDRVAITRSYRKLQGITPTETQIAQAWATKRNANRRDASRMVVGSIK